MSEIDIVIPQDTNPIEITTPTATEETEVQAEETQNNTSYNVGGDAYYTDLAKDWAIKMNGKVLGQDYSSKYYAYLAQQIEGQVAQNTEDAQIWAEGTDAQVQALGGEHSSKGWVNYVLTNPPEAYVTQTQTGCLLTVTDINGTTTAELLNGQDGAPGQDGVDGTDGADGQDGVGISSINKTSTSGLVDTYTITLSDSNTYNFTVTNGQDGAKGDKGDKGDTGNTGATGPTGNGIANIAKTSTSGLVDTYTITYTNADTDNFTVTNGQNGTNGTNGTDGQDGADGFSPIATVTKSGDTATISITDKNGTTTATISDGQDQPELTFSTGLTDTNNIISVTDYAKLIKNTATGTNSLTLLGTATGEGISINIGSSSKALGEGCIAIGADSSAGASGKGGSIAIGSGNTTSSGRFSVAMGYDAVSSADEAIQIGYGTNSTANSLNIGFYNNSTTHYNWQLLDGITGLIPDARISTNIARTVDIPTQASDINALPDSTKYGKSIDLSLNTTNYKLTLTLKDQDGTILNSKTVDFPIESVVVNGSYDSTNKKIVLTLQNGNTIDVPVGDLVAGLQTEITSSNKLSSDLVDDTSTTHKFATSSQLNQIATNTGNISLINSIIGGYGDIVTHNVSEFADSVQGGKADTALQPNDNISELINDSGYITGITSSDVTTALGYTPYNSSNPDGFITSSALANYVTTNTAQDISGKKTFLGEKAIYFKQSATTNKLGFTLYNPSNTELGAFEYRPNTISSNALLNINTSYSNACYVGFRYWGTAVNVIAPKVATAGDYFIPTHITDGNTTVTANNTGTVNISTLLPTVPTNISAFTNDSGYITSSALTGYATETWVGQQGYITGITSSDVTTALGYTPYNSTNPNGYQANVIETIKVNGTAQTVTSKAVDITVPTVNNPTITFTQGGTTKGTITLNQSNNDTIALDAGGGGGASALTDLSDVSITSASSGEALCYDGNNWINAPKTLVTIKDWTVS